MPLAFKQEAINGILFTLHFQKDGPILAYQKLIEMAGKEVMDLDQVTEFFKKIDNGEFRLEEKVKEKPKVTLVQVLNVPDFVEQYLDIDTRLRLRKTCKTIRETVNEKMLHINRLYYKSNGNFIEIYTKEGFKVLYESLYRKLRVTNGDREKVIHAENKEKQIKIIQQDLTSILGHRKLRIDNFEIESYHISDLTDAEPPIGKRVLQNTFNQLPNKLKISNLEYYAYKVDEVFIVALEMIDPEHLKCLQFAVAPFFPNFNPILKDLYDLEQWKRLKSLKVGYDQLNLLDVIRFYTHVENTDLDIRSFHGLMDVSPLHISIRKLKDKLLQSPNLKQFKILADKNMLDSDFEEVSASLQQYNTNNAPYPCWISIPYPDSDKKLEMLVNKNMIWFKGPCYVEGEESSDEED